MQGTAYTYFTTENARSARDLIKILREANSEVPYELEEMALIGGGGGGGRGRAIKISGNASDSILQGNLVEVAEAEVEVEASGPEVQVAPEVVLADLAEATAVAMAASIAGDDSGDVSRAASSLGGLRSCRKIVPQVI